jgi:RNA polymerase sigma-70 factor (ECF subfamily)
MTPSHSWTLEAPQSGLSWAAPRVSAARPSMETDEGFPRLFASARGGSPPAFAALVAPHRTRLLALLRVRIPDRLRRLVDAEDLLQETMMHAFRGIGSVDCSDDVGLRTWLVRIAGNVLNECGRRHLATRKRGDARVVDLPSSAGGTAFAAATTGALGRLRREERLQRLETALRALSPEHREVIVLCRIEGLPLAVVAERLDRTPVAASALLLRALRKLRAAFGETESFALPARGIAGMSAGAGAAEAGP